MPSTTHRWTTASWSELVQRGDRERVPPDHRSAATSACSGWRAAWSRDDAEAEDVVQEAYVHAFEHIATFRGEASVLTWMTRIVLNGAH